jgi:hypothetical protein
MPTNFLFNVLSGECCSECLATAAFIKVDNLFHRFNGGMHVDLGKTLCCPLNDDSPHTDHWTNVSMAINIWIFFKDGKPAFLHPPQSQNGWQIDTTATQHLWRTVKQAGF